MVNCGICATPYMELSRSPQVMHIAELADGDVSQRRTPNKEIVSRIELAFMRISRKYRSKARMPSTQVIRGQIGGSIRTKQHGEQ